MVSELAEKSGMNYRVLAMKVMEKWQSSIKNDKTFLKDVTRGKTIEFTMKKDGSLEIRGTDSDIRNKKPDRANGKMKPSRNKRLQPQAEDANDRQSAT